MAFNGLHNLNNLFEVRLWRLTESVSELTQTAEEAGINLLDCVPTWSARRKTEWLATRIMLADWGIYNLRYTSQGKPDAGKSDVFYSISHSLYLAAVGRSCLPFFGMDVEWINQRALRIAPRFSEGTECTLAQLSEAHATALWAAKEAIFKAVPVTGIDFRTMIRVDIPQELPEQFITVGHFAGHQVEKEFKLHFVKTEHHWLVCALAN